MPRPQPEPRSLPQPSQFLDILFYCCSIYASGVIPFIRCGLGDRAMTTFALPCFFLLLTAVGSFHYPPASLYIPLWIVAVAYRWVTADRSTYSTYQGFPWVAATIPFCRHEWNARNVEPFLVFGVGYLLTDVSMNMGRFVMGAGVALLVIWKMEKEVMKTKKRQMRDAIVIMQRNQDFYGR